MIKKIFILLITFIGLNIPGFALNLDDPNMLFSMLENGAPEVQEYNLKVAQKIIAKFEIPNTNSNFATLIIFKIDTSGNLVEYDIKESSGNTDYDNKVISAIEKAAPYPVPTFSENDGAEILVNMDLSIIRLIKMLSEQFDHPLDSFESTPTQPPTQLESHSTTTPETKQPSTKPTGIKFINPNEIKHFE